MPTAVPVSARRQIFGRASRLKAVRKTGMSDVRKVTGFSVQLPDFDGLPFSIRPSLLAMAGRCYCSEMRIEVPISVEAGFGIRKGTSASTKLLYDGNPSEKR
ncbi:hypothetical protein PILCRDRAFT_6133 [Piloderma croceum F 1598]|uniref:Uncharacterized protein n=1 Tax=Piloderma croceum (strain F 1598) TaxID=765440 RepID=A0A0C3FJ70_PILCF|nr:hypothetical protein PILCRDRAFT_6133 [Piloderma croceum F 1598]